MLRLEALEGSQQLQVTLKLPASRTEVAAVKVRFPGHCTQASAPSSERLDGALVSRWRVDCGDQGLGPGPLSFDDLSRRVGEVLVVYPGADGETLSVVARADAPTVSLQAAPDTGILHGLRLGFEHILIGIDHLLFVLGLLFLVFQGGVGRSRAGKLLWTITAFTLAHSITLAAASLGFVKVPSDAVETVIAMSILLVAVEVARPVTSPPSWASTRPATLAFGFGLLHGFGFAGALSEVGLPEGHVVTTLVLFNLGVELGQLAFVLMVGALWWGVKRLPLKALAFTHGALVHAMGAVAVYWCLDRGSSLVTRLLNS